MRLLVLLVGGIAAGFGAAGMLRPASFRDWVGFFAQGGRLYGALLFRLAAGAALIAAASSTRASGLVFWLGVLFLFSGLTGLVMRIGRLRAIAAWWAKQPAGVVRAWSLLALAIGGALLYAAI